MIRFDYMRTLSDKAWIQFYYANRRYFKLGPKDLILWLGEEMPGTLEPMKPDRLDGFRCRNCSGKLARQTDLVRQKYCHHCGQKLKWED